MTKMNAQRNCLTTHHLPISAGAGRLTEEQKHWMDQELPNWRLLDPAATRETKQAAKRERPAAPKPAAPKPAATRETNQATKRTRPAAPKPAAPKPAAPEIAKIKHGAYPTYSNVLVVFHEDEPSKYIAQTRVAWLRPETGPIFHAMNTYAEWTEEFSTISELIRNETQIHEQDTLYIFTEAWGKIKQKEKDKLRRVFKHIHVVRKPKDGSFWPSG